MNIELHKRVKSIFLAACELPVEMRRDYLNISCKADAGLREKVEELLVHHDTLDDSSGIIEVCHEEKGSVGIQPNQLIANRYRLIYQIGRGGMGEVFLAHDQLLDIQVAIKFLLSSNQRFVDKLLNEVKLARRITHPSVCHVYDVGNSDGVYFITMEYVKGEDLSSLLRRIGRLPSDKVLDIACQLCLGLAAAHAQGVLHRDLKPANIMIDNLGHVKIMDFGIATSLDWNESSEELAGTPSYMAPEQLTPGGRTTERSDLYAMGLILYEALTGKAVNQACSILELLGRSSHKKPPVPSEIVSDINPDLERVIMNVLEPDPANRPGSALEFGAGLPGVDPLWIAGQVGVTPPPDLVASIRKTERISTQKLRIFLILFLCAFVGIIFLSDQLSDYRNIHQIKSPELLKSRAETIVTQSGYKKASLHTDYGFIDNLAYAESGDTQLFWYRQTVLSDRPAFIQNIFHLSLSNIEEGTFTPIWEFVGNFVVLLKGNGDLVFFQASSQYPIEIDNKPEKPVDWREFIDQTGIENDSLREIQGEDAPMLSDANFAWSGIDSKGKEVKIHAASFRNLPLFFSVIRESDTIQSFLDKKTKINNRLISFYLPYHYILIVLVLVLAIRNIKKGSSDLKGAKKLFLILISTIFMGTILRLGHVSHPSILDSGFSMPRFIIGPLIVILNYIGLEPLARRIIPRSLIAWNKVLRGHILNQDVGLNLFVGVVIGTLIALSSLIDQLAPIYAKTIPMDALNNSIALDGAIKLRYALSNLIAIIPESMTHSMVGLFLITIIRYFIKNVKIAGICFFVIFSIVWGILAYQSVFTLLFFGPIVAGLALFVFTRYGLLAGIFASFTAFVLDRFPLSFSFNHWYSETGWMGILVVAGLALMGYLILRLNSGVAIQIKS